MAELPNRRSIRLRGYDYTRAGAYYVTVCTHDRLPLFGDVMNGVMVPNAMGEIVQRCWAAIPAHMSMVELDEFILMPNHVHGIIVIAGGPVSVVAEHDRIAGATGVGRGGKFPAPTDPAPANPEGPPPGPSRNMPVMQRGSLGHIVQTFKAAVSRQVRREGLINRNDVTPSAAEVWQRGYYERIIRDAAEHDRIAQYIAENPANWPHDRLHG